MKKTLLICSLSCILFIHFSCKKGNDSSGAGSQATPEIKLSRNTILADNFENSLITVTDQNNNDITAQCSLTINNIAAGSNNFYTAVPGTYTVIAKLGAKESLPVTITATDPGPSKYSQKALAEEYTGTWCGSCPRISYALERLQESNPKTIVVSIHALDVFAIPQETLLRDRWLISQFPTVMVNRNYKWNELPSVFVTETSKWAPLGLAIETSFSGTTLHGKVKTEFNVNAPVKMRLGIMLLQDSILHPQTNYMNTTPGPFFGLGDPIPAYAHNNTLRKFATDVFGDEIPVAVQTKGSVYEKNFTFDMTGLTSAKCDVVAFVVFGEGANRGGLLNAQIVKAGMNQPFD